MQQEEGQEDFQEEDVLDCFLAAQNLESNDEISLAIEYYVEIVQFFNSAKYKNFVLRKNPSSIINFISLRIQKK